MKKSVEFEEREKKKPIKNQHTVMMVPKLPFVRALTHFE